MTTLNDPSGRNLTLIADPGKNDASDKKIIVTMKEVDVSNGIYIAFLNIIDYSDQEFEENNWRNNSKIKKLCTDMEQIWYRQS